MRRVSRAGERRARGTTCQAGYARLVAVVVLSGRAPDRILVALALFEVLKIFEVFVVYWYARWRSVKV